MEVQGRDRTSPTVASTMLDPFPSRVDLAGGVPLHYGTSVRDPSSHDDTDEVWL